VTQTVQYQSIDSRYNGTLSIWAINFTYADALIELTVYDDTSGTQVAYATSDCARTFPTVPGRKV